MPSALDRTLTEIGDSIFGPGGPIQLGTHRRFDVDMPMILNAPPALPQMFAHFCPQHGPADFLVDGDERISFAEAYAAARQVAAALVEGYGVSKGDRVGIAMRNAPAWIVIHMGILMAGGISTQLNGWWQGVELCQGVRDTDTRLVFADAPRAKRLSECGVVHGAEIVTIDLSVPLADGIAPIVARGGSETTLLPEVTGDDLATILFTSGSTGQSKGAYSDHRGVVQGVMNYVCQTMMGLELYKRGGNDLKHQPATLLNVPLFHVTAAIPVLLQSIVIGRKLVLMPKWDALEAMRLIEREKVNYFVGVPLMSYEIMNHPDRPKFDLSTCITYAAGGAPRPPEHVKKLHDEMGGANPILGYGLTETNAVGCGNFNENYLAKPDSTGPASRPLVELAIIDDDGNHMPEGERGEVCIRSVANFLGYWNNDEATRAAFTKDGFFRTGDIGYLDADGYLFIVDRKKDIIIRGGENISCQEVEAAIYAHDAVAEASVFGLPDERFGEIPAAVVYAHPGETIDGETLTAFLAERLAAFKVPARLWFESEPLPRLGTEKIDKGVLRAKYRAVADAERQAA